MEDANFLTCRLKPGVLEKYVKAFQIPTDDSRRRYTLLEALGQPGDAVKTMMNAFY